MSLVHRDTCLQTLSLLNAGRINAGHRRKATSSWGQSCKKACQSCQNALSLCRAPATNSQQSRPTPNVHYLIQRCETLDDHVTDDASSDGGLFFLPVHSPENVLALEEFCERLQNSTWSPSAKFLENGHSLEEDADSGCSSAVLSQARAPNCIDDNHELRGRHGPDPGNRHDDHFHLDIDAEIV